MKREILTFTEFEIAPILYEYALEEDEYYDEVKDETKPGPWDDFREVQMDIDYCDLEKAYENRTVIVQRISDGKFFRGNYSYSLYWMDYDTTLEEVFPKEVTITIYE